jgi:hypothetical protein
MSFWKRSAPAAGSKWRNDGPGLLSPQTPACRDLVTPY